MHRLEHRSENILKAIISEYIATGEPVGSRIISKKREVGLSAASVRNIMSDLTEWGYIDQPHVSAGRIPTDRGIRFYVDTILQAGPMASNDEAKIASMINMPDLDTRAVMQRSSSVLAGLSKQAGVVTTPAVVGQTFKTIDFIKVAEDKILVVLVSTSGFVLNKMIYDEEGIDQETLDRYSRMLNDMLKDLDLGQARQRIEEELTKEKTLVNTMLAKVLRLGHIILSSRSTGEIFIEGQTNILEDPEFAQIEKLKAVLITFEEKSKLLTILEKTLAAEGIQIFVGTEHGLEEIVSCSIVAYPVRAEDTVLGSIAVIGPKRMDYKRMIDLVYSTGSALTHVLRKTVENRV
jgi:heat-inducible transcriptional repressor